MTPFETNLARARSHTQGIMDLCDAINRHAEETEAARWLRRAGEAMDRNPSLRPDGDDNHG